MRIRALQLQPLRAPEGGGSAAASGDGGGSGGGGPPADPLTAAVPNGFFDKYQLPDGVRGATVGETFEKLHGSWKGFRDQQAKWTPPKDATGYVYEPADPLKPYFSRQDDPWMGLSREAALKAGMPGDMFGKFMGELFGSANEKGLLPKLYNPAAEIEAIGKSMFADLQGNDQKQAVSKAINEASAFAPVLAQHLKLSDTAKAELVGMADFQGGVEALHAIKRLMAEKGIELGGAASNQGYAKDDYERDMKDERAQPFSPKYDAKFRASVDEKAKTLFGT